MPHGTEIKGAGAFFNTAQLVHSTGKRKNVRRLFRQLPSDAKADNKIRKSLVIGT
jgi:hypothetical protein